MVLGETLNYENSKLEQQIKSKLFWKKLWEKKIPSMIH